MVVLRPQEGPARDESPLRARRGRNEHGVPNRFCEFKSWNCLTDRMALLIRLTRAKAKGGLLS
jgi:hypothetical protein